MANICIAVIRGTCQENKKLKCCPHAVPHAAIVDSKGGNQCEEHTCRYCPDPVYCVTQTKAGQCVCGYFNNGCNRKEGACPEETREIMHCPVNVAEPVGTSGIVPVKFVSQTEATTETPTEEKKQPGRKKNVSG